MKTTHQNLAQLKQELDKLEEKNSCLVKGGSCCGPGKSG